MSIFSEAIKTKLPGQLLVRNTLLEYFESGPGWQILLNCNQNSEHIGLLTFQCMQVLHNVREQLWNDYSAKVKNVVVSYLDYCTYNLKVFVDQYPIGINWKGLTPIDQNLLIEILDNYGFQGQTVAHDLLYVDVTVTYESPVE